MPAIWIRYGARSTKASPAAKGNKRAKLRSAGVLPDVPRLLQLFEGLGDNCDFGMVQRAVGIEPFGLFRFASCSAADVSLILRTRFAELGESEDLWLEEVEPKREYRVKSRQFSSFSMHTKRFAGQDDPAVVRSAQIEATRFLKQKLIRDLSLNRRLYVYRGRADPRTIREVAAQLKSYGDNRLLWVRLANATHLPGSVKCLADGLLVGFVSRFGIYEPDRTPRIPVEEWIAVCAKTYRHWRNADPPKVPLKNLIARAVAERRCRWAADPAVANRLVEGPAPSGNSMFEHRLGKTGSTSVYRVHLPVSPGGIFSFSAWILIPEGFRGRRIAVSLPGGSIVSNWIADPKSIGRWQRIWVAANIPVDPRNISCNLIADGTVDDVFYSADWCLERRDRPSGYGFAI